MKKTFNLLILFLTIILLSCQNDDNIVINENFDEPNSELKIIDGRLYFPDKASFENYYQFIKEKNDDEFADIFAKKLYSKGFKSLVPKLNETTIEQYAQMHIDSYIDNTIMQKNSSSDYDDIVEHFDDVEDIFGDEVFESFLNSDAEIQIGNDIYKYTDKGLLISSIATYSNLELFMLDNNIHSLNDIVNLDPVNSPLSFNPNGGLVDIGDGMRHFLPPDYTTTLDPELDDPPHTGGGNGNGSSGNNNDDDYSEIASTLATCSGKKSILGGIFGKSVYCLDKYNKKYRVKTKYYSVDFFLGYAIGVKTKHQKKGKLGIWTRNKTEKVALGINSISWKFNVNIPQLTNNARYYIYDGKVYNATNSYYNALYAGNASMPELPFSDKVDAIVEIAMNTGVFQTEEQVTNFILQNVYGGLKSLLNSANNRQLKRFGVVIVTPSFNWVQYYDFENVCTNCSRRENIIDFGIATPMITYKFGGVGSGNVSYSWDMNFNHPVITKLSCYGMAKNNGNWYGNRLQF